MPSCAILGATGNVGSNLVKTLLSQPSTSAQNGPTPLERINVLVRSRSKLHNLVPETLDDNRIRIYESSISNTEVVRNCIRDVDAVFLTVAVTNNVPGCTVARDTANAVIAALKENRETQPSAGSASWRAPLLVVLSSATLSKRLWEGEGLSPTFHAIMSRAASHIYADLTVAEKILRDTRKQDVDLYRVTFVKTGGLWAAPSQGHVLSREASKTFTSFADVAGGMVEIASEPDREKWNGVDVSVNSAADGGVDMGDVGMWTLAPYLLLGLLFHYAPFLYSWIY